MYVIINVVIPDKIDRKQKKLFEELSTTSLETSEFKKIKDYLKKNKIGALMVIERMVNV